MKNIYKLLVLFFLNSTFVEACLKNITPVGFACSYKQAALNDVEKILSLMNDEAVRDAGKIVIVPKKFREGAIQKAVEEERMFVATDSLERIVAYKKLYIVPKDEKKDLLESEIRCLGNDSKLVDEGLYVPLNDYTKRLRLSIINQVVYDQNDLMIYTGSDFTHPKCRNQGISTQLTAFAFSTLLSKVKDLLQEQDLKRIHLAYGLTASNDSVDGFDGKGRTPGIVKTFGSFLENVGLKDAGLYHCRYKAWMPTFDPESEICVPLPDESSIAGFGNVITVKIN